MLQTPPRDGSSPKRSPWRRALNKLTPPRSGTKPSDGRNKKNKGIFSSPAIKLKTRRSKKKPAKLGGSSNSDDAVVMVKILPKSPMRYADSIVGMEQMLLARSEPASPPKMIQPSERTLETEEAFNEMFQAYIMKFHDHGSFAEDNESCSLCSKGKQIMTPMIINVEKVLTASSMMTETTSKSRDADAMTLTSNAISEVTIPASIRHCLTPQEVVNSFTMCVSLAADAFIWPCAVLPPTREGEESSNYDTNTDTEDDDDDNREVSSGEDEDSASLRGGVE